MKGSQRWLHFLPDETRAGRLTALNGRDIWYQIRYRGRLVFVPVHNTLRVNVNVTADTRLVVLELFPKSRRDWKQFCNCPLACWCCNKPWIWQFSGSLLMPRFHKLRSYSWFFCTVWTIEFQCVLLWCKAIEPQLYPIQADHSQWRSRRNFFLLLWEKAQTPFLAQNRKCDVRPGIRILIVRKEKSRLYHRLLFSVRRGPSIFS